MSSIITPEKTERDTSLEKRGNRSSHGLTKLLGVSGMFMALALPIGIYPRILQSAELDHRQKNQVERLPEVTVMNATAAPATRLVSLPGNVEADLETGIYARRDGYIRNRYVDIGDTVKAGQLLAEIETPEIDQSAKEASAIVLTNTATKAQVEAGLDKAKADLVTAKASLAQARANLVEKQSNEKFARTSTERWTALVKQGAVSSQDADEKETNYQTAQAATKAAEDGVHSAESQVVACEALLKAQLANLAVSDSNIHAAVARQALTASEQRYQKVLAPFAGVITERNIDPGTLITSGSDNSRTSLYRLAKIDEVKVYVDVPQYAATGIRVGQPVEVLLKEYPGKTFLGRVTRTSVALNASARTLRTEIHVPNKNMLLVPGMYADVNFYVDRPAHAFLIPTNALLTRAEGPQVLVATNNSVRYRSVQIGDDLGKQVEVVSGLSSTDAVVINPSDSLHDGATVKVERK